MSKYIRCDICDTKYGNWHFRKRWIVFQWIFGYMECWKDEMDICDHCIGEFKSFLKSKGITNEQK